MSAVPRTWLSISLRARSASFSRIAATMAACCSFDDTSESLVGWSPASPTASARSRWIDASRR